MNHEVQNVLNRLEQSLAGEARAVEALENIRKELKTIAEGKQEEVRNDFSSGESHGWWMALQHFESFEIANSAPLAWLAQREAELLDDLYRQICAAAIQTEEVKGLGFTWSDAVGMVADRAAALRAGATGGGHAG